MKIKQENIVLEKGYKFALRVVKLYKYLTDEKREFILSRKLLDDGTEIGASIKAAQEAESQTDSRATWAPRCADVQRQTFDCNCYSMAAIWMNRSSIRWMQTIRTYFAC